MKHVETVHAVVVLQAADSGEENVLAVGAIVAVILSGRQELAAAGSPATADSAPSEELATEPAQAVADLAIIVPALGSIDYDLGFGEVFFTQATTRLTGSGELP